MSFRHFPFSIDYLKCNIFVRRASTESNKQSIIGFSLFQIELWSLGFVNQVWIEYVELITLDNLRRWIILIVMSLVILIPFEAGKNWIEESRFPSFELILPFVLNEIYWMKKLPFSQSLKILYQWILLHQYQDLYV